LENLKRKDIDFDKKKKFYDWLEIIEEIKMYKYKSNKAILQRLEKKDVKSAEENS
jgi:hypothetical protein